MEEINNKLESYKKINETYLGYFEKLMNSFNSYIQFIPTIKKIEGENRFKIFKNEFEFVLMWDFNYINNKVVKVDINIKRFISDINFNNRRIIIKVDLADKIMDPIVGGNFELRGTSLTIDSLGNVKFNNRNFLLEDRELTKEIITQVCWNLSLNIK